MPYTKKQKKAACAAYGIAKKGGTPRTFVKASQATRREICKAPIKRKKKKKR